MSHEGRCIICDEFPKKVSWDEQEKGYICEECEAIVKDTVDEFNDDTEDVGGLGYLEVTSYDEVVQDVQRRPERDDTDSSELETGVAPPRVYPPRPS